MSSISASLDPSEEARLLSDHPSHHHHHPHHQHAHILSSAEEYSDLESEYEEEEESDPDGFLRSNQRIFFLLLEALFALIIRLWLATVSVSLLMYILRRMSMHSLVHQSGSLMSDAEVEVSIFGKHTQYRHHLPATPSLFGEIISAPIVGPLYHVQHEACHEFTINLPHLIWADIEQLPENSDERHELIQRNASNTLKWVGLVERGGCPFDQKVLNMQKAGFRAVLIYNGISEPRDVTVRMSAHALGSNVTSFAAFMSRSAGSSLNYFASHLNLPSAVTPITKIETRSIQWISKKLFVNAVVDMVVLFVLVVVTGTGFFIFGIALNLIHNLFVHGRFYAVETIHEASLIILAVSNQTPNQPKLKTVEFPRRALDENSLQSDWRSGGIMGQESCPICIEDFQIGDQVRELPCQHIFHDTCVDPWLLKHNRLCPVCKRDVLKKKPKAGRKRSSRNATAESMNDSTSMPTSS